MFPWHFLYKIYFCFTSIVDEAIQILDKATATTYTLYGEDKKTYPSLKNAGRLSQSID
jgi:hypothetical protein